MQQTYYLEQSTLIIADEDVCHPVGGMSIAAQNRKVIDEYNEKRANDELPVRTDNNGAIIESKPALAYFADVRTVCTSTKGILTNLSGIYAFNMQEQMPGILSYNKDDKTVNVMVTERDWLFGTSQRMKFGKFLRKVGRWDDDTINIMANKFKSTLHLIDNAELTVAVGGEIADIYADGPNSCMSGHNFYEGDEHPASVYDSPDIALAYVKVGDKIVARALLNMVDKQYCTIYGNDAILEPLLKKHEYKQGGLHGCRIARMPYNDVFIMPYLDDVSSVSEHSEDYFMIDDGGDVYCNCTNGLSEEGGCCFHCETHAAPDDMYYVEDDGENYCSSECIEEAGFVQALTSGGWHEWRQESEAFFCETDREWYYSDEELIDVDGEWYHQDDEDIVYSEDECEYLLKCDAADIDGLGWIKADRVTMP